MGKKPSEEPLDSKVNNSFGLEIKTKFPDLGAPGRVSTLAETMRFDPRAYEKMLQFIKDGVWDWVAAESLGVHAVTFHKWMKRGMIEVDEILKEHDEDVQNGEDTQKVFEVTPYGKFYLEVRQARAQARAIKELHVGSKNPEMWLRNGPGQTQHDLPGWTEDTQRVIHEGQIEHDIEDYTRAPTDAETLQQALLHLEDALPGGLAGLKTYIEQNKMKTIEGKVEPETNGESNEN